MYEGEGSVLGKQGDVIVWRVSVWREGVSKMERLKKRGYGSLIVESVLWRRGRRLKECEAVRRYV